MANDSSNPTRVISSTDGAIAVEQYEEPDPPYQSLWEICVRVNQREIARIASGCICGDVTFPSPALVSIPFELRGERHQITIDSSSMTFWSNPSEQHLPLSDLPSIIAAIISGPGFDRSRVQIAPKPRGYFWPALNLAVCVMFVTGGVWQAITGAHLKEHVIGVLAVIFFGACAIVPINELRRGPAIVDTDREARER